MRRRHNQSNYDSETAEVLTRSITATPDDPNYCIVTLHRTRVGHYFFHILGREECAYTLHFTKGKAQPLGEAIFPISYDEAKVFGKKNMPADVYEQEFGDVPSRDQKRTKTVLLSEDVIFLLERRKKRFHISYSESIDEAVRSSYGDTESHE